MYYDIQKESTLFLRIGDSMQIFVEETTGKTITLDDVLETDTIETIKAEIEEKEGIPIAQQHLFFNEKKLADSRTLAFYGVKA